MGKCWTVLAGAGGGGGSSYNFGQGFNVNGNTVSFALDDPSNMMFDPGFEDTPDLAQWTVVPAASFSIDTSIFFQGTRAAKTSTPNAYIEQRLRCDPSDQFVAQCYSRTSAGATGSGLLYLIFQDASGANIPGGVFSTSVPAGLTWANMKLTAVGPSNACYVRCVFQMQLGATGTWYVDNMSLRRVSNGDNIAVGAIATGHLAAGSLGDLSKYGSTVRAVAITNGLPTIDANYPTGAIIFNTFDGKLYRNVSGAWSKGTDPQDIIAGTIAAGVVYAGQISCSQINAGTLNSNVIYSGTINANQVNSGDFVGCTLSLTRNGFTTTINNGYDTNGGQYTGLFVQGSSVYSAVAGGAVYGGIAGRIDFNLNSSGLMGGGSLTLGGNNPCVVIGGNQVVFGRQHGWGSPTGTVSRASLNTGTATLATVAQTLGALINDLMTHGLIGA
jgi:hypothetical protein